MEPDSFLLVIVLTAGAVGALVLLARQSRWWVKGIAGGVAFVLAVAVGTATVNDYYGYYTSWGQLAADFSDSATNYATQTAVRGVTDAGAGRIESVQFRGARSGINRAGLVYLPPQYFEPRFADTRFPVVELIHGTPGSPSAYPVQLQLQTVVQRLMTRHEAGPTIFVMPDISDGTRFEECVDAPGALDDTYVTTDVRADVLARFRAATDPAEWGIAGLSSGGYCAANLALRHPTEFGAAGLMDAYYRPQDGPAAAALHDDPDAELANNPLAAAAALHTDSAPLPAFWISAGTGEIDDYNAAHAFVNALHGVEQVTFEREPGAGHNFYAWRAALPPLLAWMWTQLAPPSLRVQFPIAGAARAGTLNVVQPKSTEMGRRDHRLEPQGSPRTRPAVHPTKPSPQRTAETPGKGDHS